MRLCGINSRFQLLSPCMRQVTHALLTRPPLSHHSNLFEQALQSTTSASFDLHVLSTPPAFILSQDQTLIKSFDSLRTTGLKSCPFFTWLFLNLLRNSFAKGWFFRISHENFLEFSRTFHCLIIKVLCLTLRHFSQSALLVYHGDSDLSTPFFIFLL